MTDYTIIRLGPCAIPPRPPLVLGRWDGGAGIDRTESWRLRYLAVGGIPADRARMAQRLAGVDWARRQDGRLRMGPDGYPPRREAGEWAATIMEWLNNGH